MVAKQATFLSLHPPFLIYCVINSASGSAAPVSKALQAAMNAQNWKKVEPLLNKKPPKTLPDGYHYRQLKNGPRQIVRNNADDDQFAALTIDEKGKVQVADPNVSDRISNPTSMNNNFKTAMGREKLTGYQLHHLIPDNKVRSHPLMQWAQEKGFYDLDQADNLIEMPGSLEARQKALQAGKDNGVELIGHFGSHTQYDDIVEGMLDALEQKLRNKYGPNLSKPGAQAAFQKEIKALENDLRKLVEDGNVPTRIDPETGLKIISQHLNSRENGGQQA